MDNINNRIGCLILHGFAGNLQEIEPLNEYLLSKGFQTLCPIMEGHMGTRKDLARAKYTQWVISAEDAFLRLRHQCKTVIVIGFSMGGLIAVNLVGRHNINAVITLSAPIYHWDIKRIVLNVVNDLRLKDYKNIKYYLRSSFGIPFSALINFKILLNKTKPMFKQINCPIFTAHGLLDDTAHYKSADFIYKAVQSEVKQVKYYKNTDHLICHSIDNKEVFEDILDFINQVCKY